MTDIDIDAIRQQVERYTGDARASQSFLAHHLAKRVPALLAKVDELTAALAQSREQVADYAADNHRAVAQLTAANRRADGLDNDLRSAVTANTAYANENARLRTALLDVAKTHGVTHVWDHQATDWVPVTKYAAPKTEATR